MGSPSSPTRELLALAVPVIGISILNVSMLVVDTVLCARLPEGDQAMTALGYAIQVYSMLMIAVVGLQVGTAALTARAFGAGDQERIDHLVAQSTTLVLIVGTVLGATGVVTAELVLRALGASLETAAVGAGYLRVLFLGTPLFCATMLYNGLLRAAGNTRISFRCILLANVLNVSLSYVLVLGRFGAPSLGVEGAAVGTVCAQAANLAMLLVILRRGTVERLRPAIRPVRIDRALALELHRVGWPASLDSLVLNAGFLAAIAMLGHVDELAVAAHGIGLRVQSLAFVPGVALSQATAALVGRALGASDLARARSTVRSSIVLCVSINMALALIVLLQLEPLVHVFAGDGSRLEALALQWMCILAVTMLPSSVHVALVGLLQGSGATRTSLHINLVTMLALQIPLAWILAFPLALGAVGVWLSYPITFAVKALMAYVAYRREKWAILGTRLASK